MESSREGSVSARVTNRNGVLPLFLHPRVSVLIPKGYSQRGPLSTHSVSMVVPHGASRLASKAFHLFSSFLVYGWFLRALVGLCHRTEGKKRFSSWQNTMPRVMPAMRSFDSNKIKSRRPLRMNVELSKRTGSRVIWNLLGPQKIESDSSSSRGVLALTR